MSEVGQGIDHSGDGLDVESSSRRAFLTAVSVVGLDVVAGAAANPVWAEPASERPKEGDLLVSIDSESAGSARAQGHSGRRPAGYRVADRSGG